MKPFDSLSSKDGTALTLYRGDQSLLERPQCVVLMIHGFAEHMGRYEKLGSYLATRGIAAYGIDLRGHGRSGGTRAFVKSFDEYVEDIDAAMSHVRDLHSDTPIFMLGHSNGGLALTHYLQERGSDHVQGAIFSAAALAIDPDLSPLLRRLTPLIGSLIPHLKAVRLDSSLISRDPEVVQKYDSDPLVYRDGIKAGYAAAVLKTIRKVNQRLPSLLTPMLVMHGSKDKIADPIGSRRLAEEVASKDVTFKVMEGCFHEILNDPGKEARFELLTEWLLERIA
ncbi:MAG: lysophospholipase [Saprospiraceae bacterium]|nr:lysophospholipase [Saprospiraceae bacterium]